MRRFLRCQQKERHGSPARQRQNRLNVGNGSKADIPRLPLRGSTPAHSHENRVHPDRPLEMERTGRRCVSFAQMRMFRVRLETFPV